MRSSRTFLLIAAALLLAGAAARARVSHGYSGILSITYDLETVGDIAVTVSLFLSTDSGATYPNLCRTVTGNVGAGVLPGISRHMVWNAGTDFPGFSSTTCRLRVTADDATNMSDFVYIAPGTFIMGSPTTELERYSDETQHQVTLTHGIYVQATEVTNQQYRDMAQWAYDHEYVIVENYNLRDNLDGSNQILKSLCEELDREELAFGAGVFYCFNPTHPVKYVTWYGSVAYCDWLSLQQGLPRAYNHSTWQCNGGNPYTATGYRLPTEAEWEYACRAGTQTPFNTGSCLDAGTDANYNGSYPYSGCPIGLYVGWTVPVRTYPANAFGLYDMHGNMWEWCNDWYGTYGGIVTDPTGPAVGSNRLSRGGFFFGIAENCRSAFRSCLNPDGVFPVNGFRSVRSAN